MAVIRQFLMILAILYGVVNLTSYETQAQVLEVVEIGTLQGSYSVHGRNPNGTPYAGTLQVVVSDDIAFFQWKIGKTKYSGEGTLVGNVLVVHWGNSPPVIYTIDANGNLAGTWQNGKASERLIKDRPV